jgi:beta-galactosidase
MPASVPPARRKHFLTDWRMSPISPQRPNVLAETLSHDMNSWERVEPGRPQGQWRQARGYSVYRTTFTPPKRLTATGGRLLFRAVAGAAEVFVNGERVARKEDPAAGPIEVQFETTTAPVVISLLVRGTDADSGLGGKVEIVD